ncbi:MAG: cytochrome C peroxidase [Bacteroidetes bacterium]|nr:cytochrome C peroxidase [Bacteroidota bacterium]
MREKYLLIFIMIIVASVFLAASCEKDNPETDEDLISGNYDPKSYDLQIPEWLPDMEVSPDNPLTIAGVELGRRLFYDTILSIDSTKTCASCHKMEYSLTNGEAFGFGVPGTPTDRSVINLANVGFITEDLLWDGRISSIEEIVLHSIEDPIELNDTWGNVEEKLQRHTDYPQFFREAFGIEYKSEIKSDLASKAIAQFVRTLVSGLSRYERVKWLNEGFLTESEQRGLQLFFFELDLQFEHPGCSHCHSGPFLTDNSFRNNGIEQVSALSEFPDKARGAVTGVEFDNGQFKVPTLKNVALTGPYMHDGRMETLEDVLDHYSSGGHYAENIDVNIKYFELSEQAKQDMIAFLHTLTDTSFINDPRFQSPFK